VHVLSSLSKTLVCDKCRQPLIRICVVDKDGSGSARERHANVETASPPPRVGRKIIRWLGKPLDERRGDMAVQVWYQPAAANTPDPATFQSVIASNVPMKSFMSDLHSSRALQVLLTHLHGCIFRSAREQTCPGHECRTLAEFESVALRACTPLKRILRLLGTGRQDRPSAELLRRNVMARKEESALQVCVDIMYKMNCNDYVGATQTLVGWVARLNNQWHRQRTLCALSIASTGGRIDREMDLRLAREYAQRPRERLESGTLPWDAGDNFGFRNKAGGDADGGGSGYDAWYLPILHFCTRDELRGLAGPTKNLLKPYFHERRVPSSLPADVRETFGLSEQDSDYMRRRRLLTHEWAIDIATTLSTLGGVQVSFKTIAGKLRIPANWSTPYSAGASPVVRLRTPAHAIPEWSSHLEAQGSETSFACHVDPAKTATLEHLLERQAERAETEIRRHGGGAPHTARALDADGDIKFPAAWMRLYLETDGKPARQIQNLQEAKAQSTGVYEALHKSDLIEGILQFPGGFHVYKAVLADIGTCGDCVSGPLAWLFLGSEGRVAYFQDPADPRVPLLRWRQILLATEVDIFYWASKDRRVAADPEYMEEYIKKVRVQSCVCVWAAESRYHAHDLCASCIARLALLRHYFRRAGGWCRRCVITQQKTNTGHGGLPGSRCLVAHDC
jgi:hypothetical protein